MTNDEIIDYSESSFQLLNIFNELLKRMLQKASEDEKRSSVMCICEALLTGYLSKLDDKEKQGFLDNLVFGVMNKKMIREKNEA